MRIKILHFWYRLQASFWLVPALMTGGAIFLSFVTTAIDKFFLTEKAFNIGGFIVAGLMARGRFFQ